MEELEAQYFCYYGTPSSDRKQCGSYKQGGKIRWIDLELGHKILVRKESKQVENSLVLAIIFI